jgi:formylglycine-generating enzyme required for sulfatase activity
MKDDVGERLRALAKDHADGRLTLAAYRALRAPLLDSLVGLGPEIGDAAGTTQPRAAQSRAASHTEPTDAVSAVRVEAAATAVSALLTPPAPRRPGKTVAIALIAVACVGSALWLLRQKLVSSPSPAAVLRSDSATGSEALHAVIQPLIDSPDWNDTRLAAVKAALVAADQKEVAADANTEWFGAFTDSVRRRLKEQQALSDAPLDPQKSLLAAIAVAVGINLSAPDSPIRIVGQPEHAPEGAAAALASTAGAQRSGPVDAASQKIPVTAVKTGTSNSGVRAGSAGRVAVLSAPGGTAVASSSAASVSTSSLPVASLPAAVGHAPNCAAELSHARLPYCEDALNFGGFAPRLAVVPSGTFQMGNAGDVAERPTHSVTISRPFAISVQEVSQGEYRLFCQKTGKTCATQIWAGDDYPVVDTSWNDAVEYTQWLSKVTGEHYRLPTEAEWEYAARAGQTGLYPSGDALSATDAYFSSGTKLTSPAPRSQRLNANAWRLMNMVGNVREWVQDPWNPNFNGAPSDGSATTSGDGGAKVVRGGSYADVRATLRLTTRERLPTGSKDAFTGIRIVRDVH